MSQHTVVSIPNPCGTPSARSGCEGVAPGETIPIYNLNVVKRGQVQQIDKNSDQNRKWYNGVDFGFTAGVKGGNVFGGTSIGRQLTRACEVQDPNSLRFCDQTKLDIPYLFQVKLTGTYPLLYGVSVSGTWQGYPGVPTGTNRQDGEYTAASNRVIDPSLNINYNVTRTQIPNLTVASITVPLLTPGTKYLDRWNQIDLRFSKRFEYKRLRFSGQLDFFNLLNSNSILGTVETYGATLDRPTAILQGRLIAAGLQMTF